MIDLRPKVCNLCGSPVIFTSNAAVYGKEYGSGKCYLCRTCGAYVGTHAPRPREALGLLADADMRKGKMMCHALFDPLWKGKPKASKKRKDLYRWLSKQMDVPYDECHFGYFDIEQLRKAYRILVIASKGTMKYAPNGEIYFEAHRSEGEQCL